jgi:hypothetical protein
LEEYYPSESLSQLNVLCLDLIENMVKEHLLIKKIKKEKDESIAYYGWSSEVEITSKNLETDSNITKSKFLVEYINLEKYVREIYLEIIKMVNIENLILKKMIEGLVEYNVLNKKWLNNKILHQIIILRNKIIHGKTLDVEDLNTANEFQFILNRFKLELIEGYMFYISQSFLIEEGFKLDNRLVTQRDYGVDFIAKKNNGYEILFEIKHGNFEFPTRIVRDIDKISTYLTKNLESIFVMFIYLKNQKNLDNKLEFETEEVIFDKYSHLRHRIMVFYISEDNKNRSSNKLKIAFQKILNSINLLERKNSY